MSRQTFTTISTSKTDSKTESPNNIGRYKKYSGKEFGTLNAGISNSIANNFNTSDAQYSTAEFNHDFSCTPAYLRTPSISVQPKLKVGPVNDKFEREADKVADHVMSMPKSGLTAFLPQRSNKIQRKCKTCEHEEKLQSKPFNSQNTQNEFSGPKISEALNAGGRSLDHQTKRFFEPRFGVDFSNVRCHNDSNADVAARSIGARAFTVGSSIAFRRGEYSPNSDNGRKLLAHELTHTLQQSDESTIQRKAVPNPTASVPPSQGARPPSSAFNPLGPSLRREREGHGLSRDSGPIVDEVEGALFPTGGSGGVLCTPQPANFEHSIATAINTALRAQIPLSPTDAPDPMPLARKTADIAMPLINSHYSPHAPSVAPATFMASVSRKPTTAGDNIRNHDAWFAEFLGWFAGENNSIFNILSGKCGITNDWWEVTFVPWLLASGTSFLTGSNRMRERSALLDTWDTSTTSGGLIKFGRAFDTVDIPRTVLHEAMHKFEHSDFNSEVNRLRENGGAADRSITDNFTEGFTEYLARAILDPLITSLQAVPPAPLTPSEEANARVSNAYARYFNKTVELRDILYRHGQDGEEAIRRAFFLGEAWRFGLLESSLGSGSTIEMERSIPTRLTIRFAAESAILPATGTASLLPIVNYLKSRSVANVVIIGSSADYWLNFDGTWFGTSDEDALSVNRANAIRTHLTSAGVNALQITASGLTTTSSTNDETTVEINDSRNLTP